MDQQDEQHHTLARWVVMGVSGCGKSEIGQRLAEAMDAGFIEGDRYHPAANVAKMSAGTPLNDEDRAGWLLLLQTEIASARTAGKPLVLACSALKRRYRDVLRAGDPSLRFAHLAGTREIIEARMQARVSHFMPATLLDSQLRTLEPLQADEAGIQLDITLAPERLVEQILTTR